ncbi:MAG: NADP oxidoreductase [Gammaproteobacteria bacterium]|nr:NADP oxidoreductase [Gammaproteobacteria bacterium]
MSGTKRKQKQKITVSTCSLAGCFGCHMSFLDMDERLIDLIENVEFARSPINDIKIAEACDIGLVEGGLCNEDNLRTLHEFRENCRILVAVGACAINGGVPALRNRVDLKDCLETSYLHSSGIVDPQIPNDSELPLLLDKVYPIMDAVKIDYVLPGCPPPAEAFLEIVTAIIEGREPHLDYPLRRFD